MEERPRLIQGNAGLVESEKKGEGKEKQEFQWIDGTSSCLSFTSFIPSYQIKIMQLSFILCLLLKRPPL